MNEVGSEAIFRIVESSLLAVAAFGLLWRFAGRQQKTSTVGKVQYRSFVTLVVALDIWFIWRIWRDLTDQSRDPLPVEWPSWILMAAIAFVVFGAFYKWGEEQLKVPKSGNEYDGPEREEP